MRYDESDVEAFQTEVARISPSDAGNTIWNNRHVYDGACKFANFRRAAAEHLNGLRAERGLARARVNAGETGFLRVENGQFVTARSEPWILGGYTHFDAVSKAAGGADLDALLDEPIKYGANTVVWFAMRRNYNPHADTAAQRDHLKRCLDVAALRGIRVLLRVIVDRTALGWSQEECVTFWGECCEDVKGRWNVLLSLGNEIQAEGAPDPFFFALPDLAGVPASRGTMGGELLPYRPFWQFAEWESPRSFPKAIYDASTGLMQMREGNVGQPWGAIPRDVALVNTEPIGFHEVTIPGSRSSDPSDARALAAGSAFAATQGSASGVVFHQTAGQTCDSLGPRTAECAYAFFNALYAGFVR